MNCPICNTTINDIKENLFCPVCHWELAALPTNALSLRKDYEDRLVIFHSISDNSDTIEFLSNKIKCSQKENESIENEITRLKIEIRERTKQFGQLDMEWISLQKVQIDLQNKQKKLKELERQIMREKARLKVLLAMEEKVKELRDAFKVVSRRGIRDDMPTIVVIKRFLEDYNKVISEK